MKIYKNKQFLIFDLGNGKTVQYDFATKKAIGKSGKPVKDLKSQLRGLTIDELCDCCEDKQYGEFLKFVRNAVNRDGYGVSNIGTILSRVPQFSNFEQLFSAGIHRVNANFRCHIRDVPPGLMKLCRNRDLLLSNELLRCYQENPNAYILAYNLEYVSLTDSDLYKILTHTTYMDHEHIGRFNRLIQEYGYTAKSLLLYIDRLKTYEAIEDPYFLLRELEDYCSMMRKISPKFDRYPRNFLTTHRIAARNYNRLKKSFEEEDFKKRINKDMELTCGDYKFYYPNCTQDIKDEAVQMNNCVASYIQRVINGECHILFLRRRDDPEQSVVTIEVKNDRIVQALQRFNAPVDKEQQQAVNRWNDWWANKIQNKNESEEMNYAG